MSKMGQAVQERMEKIRANHASLKKKKHGWLVRPLTLTGGWLVVLVGLVTIPFPGPGWLTVFIGVGILSLELEWPHRLLGFGIRQYDKFDAWWMRQGFAMRMVLTGLLLVLIWVVFALLFWVGWRMGMLDFTRPWLQEWVDKLPDWVGLS
ncbi:MAG TPA: TIGR02611 family protein [Candidatus Corynebacterium gallistercoris]|uniref:TIGR02611 family protein n=1 Tax=Candidatus Corynebacterium gallistercoris TaxID=2838530 RepID=A0A9D1UQ20_9CORY|nr:TIGR02611 family protein [Candidatus Corynebacterium gallistercoris]